MNKFGIVFGVAAVATLAGCKDPDYKRGDAVASQSEVKTVETAPVAESAPTVAVEPAVKRCTCAPGTKHAEPCKCGAPDCACVVEVKPVVVADVSKPAEPEYTIYVVQNGDYLAKISKRFNVTIASIKRLNPSIKKDVIWVGQKLKLPGKIDVSAVAATPVVAAAAVPVAKSAAKAPAKVAAKKSSFTPYTGATKEYVVKSGDSLGSVAYGNGINIRQLKELNGLSSDSLKIGQKLKIPAEKVVKAAEPAKKAAAEPAKAAAPAKPETAVAPGEKPEAVAPADSEAAPAEAAPAADEVAAAPAAESAAPKADSADSAAGTTYVVQEGDDMTGVSIRWGVSAAEIRELNNLAEGDQLVPGQIIKLPADAQQ